MNIPDKVKVGGQTYAVIKNYKFHQDTTLCGQADHNQLEIRLTGIDITGKELKKERLEEVFLHELLHCIDTVYNNNSIEEKVIQRLAYGVHQVLVDNDIL